MSALGSPGGADAVVSEEKVHYSKRSRDEDRSGERGRIMETGIKRKKAKPQEAFITEKVRKTLLRRVCMKKA